MSRLSRRKLLMGSAAAAAGAGGLAVAARWAERYGLVPPDSGGIWGPGETLTYAAHRLLAPGAPAREFPRSQISATPFANGKAPDQDNYRALQAGGFADWRLTVDGLVARPQAFSLSEIQGRPTSSQVTQLICEEGWSFIAEWIGTPLSAILDTVGMLPQARYVVYRSLEEGWWESIDLVDALHPQTLVTYAMNGQDLPVGHGGPLRLRLPRQLGYKSLKFLVTLTVTDDLKQFGKGLGSSSPEYGYAWYAGI